MPNSKQTKGTIEYVCETCGKNPCECYSASGSPVMTVAKQTSEEELNINMGVLSEKNLVEYKQQLDAYNEGGTHIKFSFEGFLKWIANGKRI